MHILDIINETQNLDEFERTDVDGREFMSYQEFLAILTPGMRQYRFNVDKTKYPSMMYSRKGRTAAEFFIIVVEPADELLRSPDDQVHYVFGSVSNGVPDIEDEGLITLDQPGAKQLLDLVDDNYGIT